MSLFGILSLAISAAVGARVARRVEGASPLLWLGAAALTAGVLAGAAVLTFRALARRRSPSSPPPGTLGVLVIVHIAAAALLTWFVVGGSHAG